MKSRPMERHGRRTVSLDRGLSKLGAASRSQAGVLIREGHVSVNGTVVRDTGHQVDLRTDRIALRGKTVRAQERIYIALHKPAGVVTTRSDERGRKTVYHYLPSGHPWVFPVGRLDMETSGLLLLTNDTRLGQRLTDPEEGVPKRYLLEVDVPFASEELVSMRQGMALPDGTQLRSAKIRAANAHQPLYELTLHEGKNRQIRRMAEAFGRRVVSLVRTSIGEIELGKLRPGESRPLSAEEIASLPFKEMRSGSERPRHPHR